MKKCALFLLCTFFMASCNKNEQVEEIRTSDDYRLEASIERDVQQLSTILVNFVSGKNMETLDLFAQRLKTANALSEVDPIFTTEDFQNLQIRLYGNMKIFSDTHSNGSVEEFAKRVAQISSKPQSAMYAGTPCYDAWDLSMGASTAAFLVCLAYSPELLTKSRCAILYGIAVTQAEIKYQRCIELSY